MTFRDILNRMDKKAFIYYGNHYLTGIDSVHSCFENHGDLLDKNVISIEATELPNFGNLIRVKIGN